MSVTVVAVGSSSSSLSSTTTRKASVHARKLTDLCSPKNHSHLKIPINFHHSCKLIARVRPPSSSPSSRCVVAAFSPTDVEEEVEDEEEEEEEEEDDDDDEAVTEDVPEGRRLYVGNLPYSVTKSELQEIFGEAGRIESVEVVYDRVTDRSRGFGFVTMGSVEEAKEAIRMFDGSQVGGRSVKVNFPEVPRGAEREVMGPRIRHSYRGFVDSPFKVYAGNLGWRVTSEILKDAFEGQPGLLSAKVLYDKDTGKSRGYGFLSFTSSEEAQSAIIAMNGVDVEGRSLRLNLAVERERSSALPLNPEEKD